MRSNLDEQTEWFEGETRAAGLQEVVSKPFVAHKNKRPCPDDATFTFVPREQFEPFVRVSVTDLARFYRSPASVSASAPPAAPPQRNSSSAPRTVVVPPPPPVPLAPPQQPQPAPAPPAPPHSPPADTVTGVIDLTGQSPPHHQREKQPTLPVIRDITGKIRHDHDDDDDFVEDSQRMPAPAPKQRKVSSTATATADLTEPISVAARAPAAAQEPMVIDDDDDWNDALLSTVDIDAVVAQAAVTAEVARQQSHEDSFKSMLRAKTTDELMEMLEKNKRKEADLSSKIVAILLEGKGGEEEKTGFLQQRTELQQELAVIAQVIAERNAPPQPPPPQQSQQQAPKPGTAAAAAEPASAAGNLPRPPAPTITEWVSDRLPVPRDTATFPAATTNWSRSMFPWSPNVEIANRQVFGHKTFRENQLEVINASMAGHDCFVLMPTGGGKCLAPDTLVLLGDGSTARADAIRVGDILVADGDTGWEAARVVLSTIRGVGPLYRVFRDSEEGFVCNNKHLLVFETPARPRLQDRLSSPVRVLRSCQPEPLSQVQELAENFGFPFPEFATRDAAFERAMREVSGNGTIVSQPGKFLVGDRAFEYPLPGTLYFEDHEAALAAARARYDQLCEKHDRKLPPVTISCEDLFEISGGKPDNDAYREVRQPVQQFPFEFDLQSLANRKLRDLGMNQSSVKCTDVARSIGLRLGGESEKFNLGGEGNVAWLVAQELEIVGGNQIPSELMRATRDVRLHLLAGFIDAAGHCNEKERFYEVSVRHEKLTHQLAALARGLGFRASVGTKAAAGSHDGRRAFVAVSGQHLCDIPVLADWRMAQSGEETGARDGVEIEKLPGEGRFAGFMLGMFTSAEAFLSHVRARGTAEAERALREMVRSGQVVGSNAEGAAAADGRHAGRFLLWDHTVTHNSLCFQLPTVCREGVTVVISPLISLIQDQVDALLHLGIEAALLNSATEKDEADRVFEEVRNPRSQLKLLYLTPEKITASGKIQSCLKEMARTGRLQMVTIDEAHCVSQWGHDFRPDYVNLKWFKQMMPGVPMMMLTATATDRVKTDILYSLGIRRCLTFKQTFNRRNLRYSVRKKSKKALAEIVQWIKDEYPRNTGIIYCLARHESESIAEYLRKSGLSAECYHGAMDTEKRSQVQRKWSNDEVRIVCATVAFGMGIDKPDVRFVIHYSLPKCLENYYQESGRAGRDGQVSHCILYYQYSDKFRLEKLVQQSARENGLAQAAVDAAKDNLMRMVAYAEDQVECRRTMQLQYFGEHFDRQLCQRTCDNCENTVAIEHRDFTDLARAAVAVVREMADSDTLNTFVTDVLRGSKGKRVLDNRYNSLTGYGAAKSVTKQQLQEVIHQLIKMNVLAEDVTFHDTFSPVARLRIGRRAEQFLASGRLSIAVRADSKSGRKISAAAELDVTRTAKTAEANALQLLDQLTRLRKQILDEEGVLAHHLFPQTTLEEMAIKCPTTEEQFLDLAGVTFVKCSKYGQRFMAVIREYVAKHGKPVVPAPTSAVVAAAAAAAAAASASAVPRVGGDQQQPGVSRFFNPPVPSSSAGTSASSSMRARGLMTGIAVTPSKAPTSELDEFKFEDSV